MLGKLVMIHLTNSVINMVMYVKINQYENTAFRHSFIHQ